MESLMDLGLAAYWVQNIRVETYLAGTAAFATVGIFVNQWLKNRFERQLARENWKLQLLKKRLELYRGLRAIAADFWREGKPNVQLVQKVRSESSEALFLFPEELTEFLEELVRHSAEHQVAESCWGPLRARADAGEKLSDQEEAEKKEWLSKKHEQERWFFENLKSEALEERLAPYLKIPPDI
ncbi:MAG: hypothetical protein ACQEUZ_10230 [Pseudomonadota bacterium]